MSARPFRWLLAAVVVLGCGSTKEAGTNGADSGPSSSDDSAGGGGGGGGDGAPGTGDNSIPMVVNTGPTGAEGESVDVPFVTITICVPGTTTCQTIDYISVDTGSTGLRIISTVLDKSLSLPQAKASTGSALAECYAYADGYTWGSVRSADVKLGGEVASSIPIHIIGDPAFPTVPSDCSSFGSPENTVETFGANGIIGLNQLVPDCGEACADPNNIVSGMYYSCATPSTCADAAVPVANQVPNPVGSFPEDKNGVILQFPSVPSSGAASLSGTLVFGIGTADNNGLGSAKVMTVDDIGNFSTIFNGSTFPTSFLDSGTNSYAFNDSSIPTCPDMNYFFCPTSPVELTAMNEGRNNVTTNVSLSIGNADQLFMANQTYAAFNDIGGPGLDNMTFDWGFPFFIGKNVYVGFAVPGATPNGYFAY
jgi:hypothetical protein